MINKQELFKQAENQLLKSIADEMIAHPELNYMDLGCKFHCTARDLTAAARRYGIVRPRGRKIPEKV